MFGAVDENGEAEIGESQDIYRTFRVDQITTSGTDKVVELRGGKTVTIGTGATYYTASGATTTAGATNAAYVTVKLTGKAIQEISISPETFPGTYMVIGDTFARSETTGKDESFQLIIPKAKMQSEVTLTMEADGDPSTFDMNLKVLRPKNGPMMKLVKYDF